MSQIKGIVSCNIRDLEVLPQNEEILYEIIDGELFVTRSPHRLHQQACGKIFSQLDAWSESSGLGEAIIAPGIVFSDQNNVVPDVVWISKERLALLEDKAGHLTCEREVPVQAKRRTRDGHSNDSEETSESATS